MRKRLFLHAYLGMLTLGLARGAAKERDPMEILRAQLEAPGRPIVHTSNIIMGDRGDRLPIPLGWRRASRPQSPFPARNA